MCEEILIETCFRKNVNIKLHPKPNTKTITHEVCRCTAKLLKELRIDIFLSYKAKNVPFLLMCLTSRSEHV